MTEKPRWWLAGAAALLAALYLYQSIGWSGASVLIAGAIAGSLAYRFYRRRKLWRPNGARCPICGERLAATAVECRHCGSARRPVN